MPAACWAAMTAEPRPGRCWHARALRWCCSAIAGCSPRALLAQALDSNALGALETLCAWFASGTRLRDRARIEGLEHLRAALAEGRGAVVVGAHYDGIE